MSQDRIVADGQRRLHQTESYQQKAQEIRARVHAKYRASMAESGLFKRLLIGLKMQREIRREVRDLAPEGALYVSQSTAATKMVAKSNQGKK